MVEVVIDPHPSLLYHQVPSADQIWVPFTIMVVVGFVAAYCIFQCKSLKFIILYYNIYMTTTPPNVTTTPPTATPTTTSPNYHESALSKGQLIGLFFGGFFVAAFLFILCTEVDWVVIIDEFVTELFR